MSDTVAAKLVQILVEAGVRRIYGIVGDSLNAITEEIRRNGSIEWVHCRHEEAAAFAAGAEAQLTGRLAVCAGSCGPGNLHLINGLYDCHRTGAPVLAIAAHIPTAEIGTGYFQETHPERLFVECSHYCEVVASPAQMPRTAQMAIQHAVAMGGVATLILSGDVALETVPASNFSHPPAIARPCVRPSDEDLKRLAALLQESKRITLLCGAGCAGAHEQLLALAEALNAPIVHSLRGKEHVEHDNPYDVGMTGLIGFASGYEAMMACDALLMLGTDFPYVQFYPSKARIAQIDIRAERLGRRCNLELGLAGDVRTTLDALLPLLEPRSDQTHLDEAREQYGRTRRDLDSHVKGTRGHTPIHPEFLTSRISEIAAPDAIFTVDVGETVVWAARYLRMRRDQRLLGSFVHGSMANALPQAIGAQATYPDRQVISLSGDGGFAMLMGDFLTLVQQRLPIKVVIYNNGTLGFVEIEQKVAGLLDFGTDLVNPNFAKVAEAVGVLGFRVEDPADLNRALAAAFTHRGPALIDVVTNRHELPLPPKTTLQQAGGFTLYSLKAVLSGRGRELVELVESNLR
jgi:pyruvate dehydrogenase (quinone)